MTDLGDWLRMTKSPVRFVPLRQKWAQRFGHCDNLYDLLDRKWGTYLQAFFVPQPGGEKPDVHVVCFDMSRRVVFDSGEPQPVPLVASWPVASSKAARKRGQRAVRVRLGLGEMVGSTWLCMVQWARRHKVGCERK
jgi:hypothetical protein